MSEHPADDADGSLVASPNAEPAVEPATQARRGRPSAIAVVALVLALAEAGALAVVWTHPRLPGSLQGRLADLGDRTQAADTRAGSASAAVASVGTRLDGMQAAIEALQRRPVPTPAPPAPPPFDPHPLQAEIDGLRSALDGERAAIAQAAGLASGAQKTGASLGGTLDALSGKVAGLQSGLDALSTRLDREGAAGRQVASLAASAERLARLQAASVALSIGRPTGAVPNAPPALARFATEAPPTEASLILAFPDAAAATLKASEPDTAGKGFFKRLWVRAQSAVSVRDGDRVLLGDPAAGIVAAARARLAAGDLDGAVSVLGALSGPAADAMDGWRSKAASLVDARAALASMMARQ